MNTSAAADLSCALHRRLRAQVGSSASADVALALQSFEHELRQRLPAGSSIQVQDPGDATPLHCPADALIDLLLALFAWAGARGACCVRSHPECRPGFTIEVQGQESEVEIAIWEAHPTALCVHSLALWSQVGAKIEQWGARMQVGALQPGQWRRFWLERSKAVGLV